MSSEVTFRRRVYEYLTSDSIKKEVKRLVAMILNDRLVLVVDPGEK